MKKKPFLSIIIPMYNRAKLIERSLDSCLSQDFNDFEIVVVDDCSEDRSVHVVERFIETHPEQTIILLKNTKNMGLCATRGKGVGLASGRWIGFLDSDDTFKPGAFRTIYEKSVSIPPDVSEMRFCYWSEEHECITPVPMMPTGVIAFREYLMWIDRAKNTDLFYCHRREVYSQVQWPEGRQYSGLFYLTFASKFKMQMFADCIGTMHNDAKNRNTNAKRGKGEIPEHILKSAMDNAVETQTILMELGDEMKLMSPNRYRKMKRSVAQNYFVAGKKWLGIRYSFRYLRKNMMDSIGWAILVLGVISPRSVLRGRGYLHDIRKKY